MVLRFLNSSYIKAVSQFLYEYNGPTIGDSAPPANTGDEGGVN